MIERRHRVADMYLEGYQQTEIAAIVGISKPTVTKDLAWAKLQWRELAAEDWRAAQNEELAKLRKIEREAWKELERARTESRESRTITTGEPGGGAERRTIEQSTKTTAAPATYLRIILDCIIQRANMLGLFAPKKHAHTIGGDPEAPPVAVLGIMDRFNGLALEQQEFLIDFLGTLSYGGEPARTVEGVATTAGPASP